MRIAEKALMLEAAKYNEVIAIMHIQRQHRIRLCAYIYDLANAFNRFIMRQRFWQKKIEGKEKVILHF